MNDLKIISLKGQDILPYIPELAKLRINTFKEYPYLYEGNLEYEYKYLDTYIKCSDCMIILVIDGSEVVGASTSIPMEFETSEFKQPFLDNLINPRDIFYFGESVLRPEYRGRNIYRHFFSLRENNAKKYGSKVVTFAAIERPEDDARKPQNYIPLNDVWKHFGYTKHPELRTQFEWQEVGEQTPTYKTLIFWMKQL